MEDKILVKSIGNNVDHLRKINSSPGDVTDQNISGSQCEDCAKKKPRKTIFSS